MIWIFTSNQRSVFEALARNSSASTADNLEALKFVGLKPSRKIKLFNASLEARLVKYEMYEGSKRTKFQTQEDKTD